MIIHTVFGKGEKTVISIVRQILKTISDGDHLDSLRFLMLDGSLIFFLPLFLQLLGIIL